MFLILYFVFCLCILTSYGRIDLHCGAQNPGILQENLQEPF